MPSTRSTFHCVLQLVAVLREVKYLELRQKSNIPESAINIYEKNDTLRQFGQNLDLMVFWYNKVGTYDMDYITVIFVNNYTIAVVITNYSMAVL